MRRMFFATTAAAALLTGAMASAAHAEWISMAMNADGAGYGSASTEGQAKLNALNDCRSTTGYQCYVAVAVDPNQGWVLSGVYCNGQPMVAGSQNGYSAAKNYAAQKLGYSGWNSRACSVYDTW